MAITTIKLNSYIQYPLACGQSVYLCLQDYWQARTVSGRKLVLATLKTNVATTNNTVCNIMPIDACCTTPDNTVYTYCLEYDDDQMLEDPSTSAPWSINPCVDVRSIIPDVCLVEATIPEARAVHYTINPTRFYDEQPIFNITAQAQYIANITPAFVVNNPSSDLELVGFMMGQFIASLTIKAGLEFAYFVEYSVDGAPFVGIAEVQQTHTVDVTDRVTLNVDVPINIPAGGSASIRTRHGIATITASAPDSLWNLFGDSLSFMMSTTE